MQFAYLRVVLISVVVALVAPVLQAEDARFRVEPVVTRDGFLRSTVFAIMQDRHGFLWFGTRNGLLKYDGYTNRSYACENISETVGISDCTILSVAEDSTGYIWAGTQEGGLVRLDRRTGALRNFRHDPRDPTSLNAGAVTSIVVDAGGTLWIATDVFGRRHLGGIARYDHRTGRFIRYNMGRPGGLPAGNYTAPYIDRRGDLWVCSSTPNADLTGGEALAHLALYDRESDRFTVRLTIPVRQSIEVTGEHADGSLALVETGTDGRTKPLVRLFDPKGTAQIRDLDVPMRGSLGRADHLLPIRYDENGDCWFVMSSAGGSDMFQSTRASLFCEPLVPFDAARKATPGARTVPRSILVAGIYMLFTDRSGVIWAATEEGVVKISRAGAGFITWRHDPTDPFSLSAPRIRSVFVDRLGILWAGTDLGLNRYDRSTGRWHRYYWEPGNSGSLPSSTVNTIHEDRAGRLLFGTNRGPAAYDRMADRFTASPLVGHPDLRTTACWSILSDRHGRTWIGTGIAGLSLFDSTGRFIRAFRHDPSDPNSFPDRGVWALLEDSRGTIWVGTNDGLCRWLPESGRFKRYVHQPGNPRSIGSNRVWDIHEDRSGQIWVSTYGRGGISRYDRIRDDFTTITTRDGLPSDNIFGMLEDRQGMFWISTTRGLAHWDRQRNTFRVYDKSDGLQGDEFSFKAFFRAPDGTFYFGGTEGLTAFRPEDLRRNVSVPPVLITGFRLFDSLVSDELLGGDTIRLEHDQNFFSFDFSALDYINPEKNRYSYILDGVDPAWVSVGSDQRAATYTDIRPGIYTFRVHGSNNDGVWNRRGLSLTIIIDPPWWATLWFRLAATVVATLLVVTLVRLRINGIRNGEREKQQSALQTALESQESERQRIARDLHDGVGQMLAAAGINVSRAREMIKRDAGRDDAAIDSSMARSLAILAQASSDVRTISHALGTSTLRELGLTAALQELIDNLGPQNRTRFEFETVGLAERIPEPLETGLFRVAQELIANVLRHADATEATVQIVREGREIRMTVEDNGVGFDAGHMNGGMGRRNIAGRVSVMAGMVSYDTTPGHGTTVTVAVPVPVSVS